MPFFKSSLNVFDVIELEIGVDPRAVSDFLIEISEQEFCEIKSRRTPRAADVCHECGAIEQFENNVCRVCGTRR